MLVVLIQGTTQLALGMCDPHHDSVENNCTLSLPAHLTPGEPPWHLWAIPAQCPAVSATAELFFRSDSEPERTPEPPVLEVLSPHLDDETGIPPRWPLGSMHAIRWALPASAAPAVQIDLLYQGRVRTLVRSAPNTGRYDWAIAPTLHIGMHAVRVMAAHNASLCDEAAVILIDPTGTKAGYVILYASMGVLALIVLLVIAGAVINYIRASRQLLRRKQEESIARILHREEGRKESLEAPRSRASSQDELLADTLDASGRPVRRPTGLPPPSPEAHPDLFAAALGAPASSELPCAPPAYGEDPVMVLNPVQTTTPESTEPRPERPI